MVSRAIAGRPAAFDGRTHCPFDVGDGRGTFVTGSYVAPVTKSPPTRLKHLMKVLFGRIYRTSLRGWLEPVFDAYFALTAPRADARASAVGRPAVPSGGR